LKHGASLIYTTPSVTSQLQGLVHSSLGIYSLLKRQPIKHNVIDRDKVVVPPNWDSWGKIRVLRDGFDVEYVNNGWSLDIEEPLEESVNDAESPESFLPTAQGAVEFYGKTIRDPSLDTLQATTADTNGHRLEVSSLQTQSFLAAQAEILEKIRSTADAPGMDSSRLINGRQVSQSIEGSDEQVNEGRVNDHIGPVSFNMGGIQVDADDMLQRLKDRQAYQTPEPTGPGGLPSSADGKTQNEALASFFAGLMKRSGSSATSSPKPGSS